MAARSLCPAVSELAFLAHLSAENGHGRILDFIGARPVLDLDMRLGEGSGAAVALHLLEASVRIFNEMATFGEAGVKKEN
jgi:nicotinate-nucleotide--dimethylbenzimidazole phosphoribosyltransferase